MIHHAAVCAIIETPRRSSNPFNSYLLNESCLPTHDKKHDKLTMTMHVCVNGFRVRYTALLLALVRFALACASLVCVGALVR